MSRRYLDDPLHLSTATGELGLADSAGLTSVFRLPRFTALGLMPLAAQGVIRRDAWEDYHDQVVRQLGLGIPMVPLDGLNRKDYPAGTPPFEVELKTNKKGNRFEPGEEAVIFVTNRAARDIYIELVGTSAKGRKVVLVPGTTRLRAGATFRFPSEGAIKVRGGVGKEQVSLLASVDELPAAELLRGKGVTDRVVHPFYRTRLKGKRPAVESDPALMVKKTIEIETR